jgi:putative endonuclease
MTKYFLYILYSPRIDQYYIGISQNPEKRLLFHNTSPKGWSRRGRPWSLDFTKEFKTRKEVKRWENWIKEQKDRGIIEKIIARESNWN